LDEATSIRTTHSDRRKAVDLGRAFAVNLVAVVASRCSATSAHRCRRSNSASVGANSYALFTVSVTTRNRRLLVVLGLLVVNAQFDAGEPRPLSPLTGTCHATGKHACNSSISRHVTLA
jgi:hypothetical protein